jgi:hypothetical protein
MITLPVLTAHASVAETPATLPIASKPRSTELGTIAQLAPLVVLAVDFSACCSVEGICGSAPFCPRDEHAAKPTNSAANNNFRFTTIASHPIL